MRKKLLKGDSMKEHQHEWVFVTYHEKDSLGHESIVVFCYGCLTSKRVKVTS